MKKWTLLLPFLIIPWFAKAQLQLGIRAGYDYFWYSEGNDHHILKDYDESHNAPVIGIQVATREPSHFNVALEADYIPRSFHLKYETLSQTAGSVYDLDVKGSTLYVQLLPQFIFGKKLKFIFYPGLSVGFTISSSAKGTAYGWNISGEEWNQQVSYKSTGYYPKDSFGFVIGSGIEYPVGKNLNATLDLRFNMNNSRNIIITAGVAYVFQKVKLKK